METAAGIEADQVGVRENQHGKEVGKSSVHVDRLIETELQSSIFRLHEDRGLPVDFQRFHNILKQEGSIPLEVADTVLLQIQDNLDSLGLSRPGPSLILHWLTGLLREQGYDLGEIPLQSLELSLGDVEMNIYHPVGFGAGVDQNPEATSQRIAQRIKTQFACRRVFQEDVVKAHDEGRIELLHLGAIDRPHDVFLTPDYLKLAGLPVTSGAPAAGPARRADVLLAHLIRFTHELRNHFAGDIQWGYVNILLAPFLAELSELELEQFVQHMLFEFGQLDVERGGHFRQVILDFDFDFPRQILNVPAVEPGGQTGTKTYGDYRGTFNLFNEIAVEILTAGDFRGSPFHSPRIVYHFNDPKGKWTPLHQRLMNLSFKFGNPTIAFSSFRRDLGALGQVSLNHPDFLKKIHQPSQLRGFSSSSLAINVPRLVREQNAPGEAGFAQALEQVLALAVSAHRQKRLFISRLMAYGNRGPLQFLRHKVGGQPFLKINRATQPMHLIGLGEAAALRNGSPRSRPEVIGAAAETMLKECNQALTAQNRIHKLGMFLSSTKNENVAYRFAFLDLNRFGQTYGAYVLRKPEQAHPIYTEGPNILAFTDMKWRDRFKIEGRLHAHFSGHHALVLFLKNGSTEVDAFCHKVFQEAQSRGLGQVQPAPDLNFCMSCFAVFHDSDAHVCPACNGALIAPHGLCQANFSPVHSWCLGKRAEWRIRHRVGLQEVPIQVHLPW